MRIRTDFWDYYDSSFDYGYTGPVFERIGGNTGPGRREQHDILEAAGFIVPPHGLFEDIIGDWWEQEKIFVERAVVYDDETAHCSEGKRMSQRLMEEFDLSRGKYSCAFVGDPNAHGVSWRRLQVGRHVWWLEYWSDSSWMSNVDGQCKVIGRELNVGFHPVIRRPLFAIDFVLGREMYAVDLNFSPGMRGSGMEDEMPPEQVVAAITEWFDTFGSVQ